MPRALSNNKPSVEVLQVAERLRQLISEWVQTTRDRAGTPTSSQMETLRLLNREGPASIAQLAERRSVKHQSMRLVLAQLDTNGTVQRAADPKDGRSQIVAITAKGRTRLKAAQRTRALWIAQVLEGASPAVDLQDVAAAIDCLQSLLAMAARHPPS